MVDNEVTRWLDGLVAGEEAAIREVWERYYHRVVGLARKKLGDAARREADEEDVAQSAFFSFCRRAEAGRFPKLDDRSDLWRLLATITSRKAASRIRRAASQKRGHGAVRGESVFAGQAGSERDFGLADFAGAAAAPDAAAMVAEECRRLIDQLPDDSHRDVALAKLEGYDNSEIAERLGCASRTVERKLKRIRECWAEQAPR